MTLYKHFIKILLISLLACSSAIASQNGSLSFETIGDKYSIPHGIVTKLFQDKQGFIWIGTQNGLVRFDGYRYKIYKRDRKNRNSIAGDFIRAIHQAPDGKLWIGTMNDGVAVFDNNTETFQNFSYESDNTNGISHNRVAAILSEPNGDMWLGTGGGLNFFSRSENTFIRYNDSFISNDIRSLLLDADGQLWVGTNKGLYKFIQASKSFVKVHSSIDDNQSFADESIEALYQSHDGKIWVGTKENGLAYLSSESGKLTRFTRGVQDTQISHQWISSIIEPIQGEIWASTFGGGINIIDTETNTRKEVIQYDSSVASSINLDSVSHLFVDNAGLLWVGTWGGGLNRNNIKQQAFRILRHSAYDPTGLSHPDVYAILELKDGRWLVGTSSNGIDILDQHFTLLDGIRRIEGANIELSNIVISALAQTEDDYVWIGTINHGLWRLDLKRLTFKAFNQSQGLIGNSISKLLPDQNNLWVGTHTGLSYINNVNGTIKSFTAESSQVFSERVNTMAHDKKGNIWVGTNQGLFYLAIGSQKLRQIKYELGDTTSLSSGHISGLLFDRNNELWIDTAAGLNRLLTFDGMHAKFESISDKVGLDGLSFGSNLLEDNSGNIWTQWHVLNPNRLQVRKITQAEGADIGTAWMNSNAKSKNGKLLFGGTEGILVVSPELFRLSNFNPPIVITDIEVDGIKQAVKPFLTLDPTKQGFSIEFASLDYSLPQQNKYSYKLEGFNDDWVETSADNRRVTYTNLPPGDYTLYLKGTNYLGHWSEHSAQMKVTVMPSFYQTAAFRLAIGLAIFITFYSLYLYRVNQLKRSQELLETQVEQRTLDLKKAHEDLAVISDIGKEITATLDLDLLLEQLYTHTTQIMKADSFGIGIYHQDLDIVKIELAVEDGVRIKPYQRDMNNKNQLAVWCIEHNDKIFIQDAEKELIHYFEDPNKQDPEQGFELESGNYTKAPQSYLYVPLTIKNTVIGIITAQSYHKNAYSTKHLQMLETLATYAAIAIDNANKLKQINNANDNLVFAQQALQKANEVLEEISVTDQLTGLKNRMFLIQHIGLDIEQVLREYHNWQQDKAQAVPTKQDMIFFLIDLDHFKSVNDTYGHGAGDNVLVAVKTILESLFRESDYLIRWGGEEFLVVARFTQRAKAPVLAERIRATIEAHEFTYDSGEIPNQTCSIGFACFPFVQESRVELSWEHIVEIADKCLYAAKISQRNAWVGVYGEKDIASDTFIQHLSNAPDKLLLEGNIKLITSISSDKKIIWQ